MTTTADAASLFPCRVTVFAGHFGSGKTELAINAALGAAVSGPGVSLLDLDVVKPYFRSRSAQEVLEAGGVELVAPQGEYTSADLPMITSDVRGRLRDPGRKIFIDAGGNDMGVRALSSVLDAVPVDVSAVLLVLNFRRPFTPDVESAITMARAIETSARLSFTGIISNTHLIRETTPSVVLEGHEKAVEASARLGLPVLAVAVEESLLSQFNGKSLSCPLFALRRAVKPPFEKSGAEVKLKVRKTGPLFKVG